jgi:hypothetical protein
MPERPSALSVICVLWLLNSAIGARVAVRERLPAEWVADLYVGRDASAEFFKGGGTALSPGLPMIVVQALFTVLGARGGTAGRSGVVGLLRGLPLLPCTCGIASMRSSNALESCTWAPVTLWQAARPSRR